MNATAELADDRPWRSRPWLTLETGLYGLYVIAAAALRFQDLDGIPLGSHEAAHAWPAWALATGRDTFATTTSPTPTSALLFSLQWLGFWLLGGGGDLVARWPSAALGSVLALTPWLIREWLGRSTALAVAGLLAVDPVLVALGRSATPGSATVFAALLTLGCLFRAAAAPRANARWVIGAGVSGGLFLVSGPQAWNLIVLAVLGAGLRPQRIALLSAARRALPIAAVTALAVATIGLIHAHAGGHVSASLTAWNRQWPAPARSIHTAPDVIAAVIARQALPVALAVVASALSGPRATGRIVVLTLMAVAMAGAPDRTLDSQLPLTLLLVFGGAPAVTAIIELCRRSPYGWMAGATAMLLLLPLVREATRLSSAPDASLVSRRHADAAPGIRSLASDLADVGSWRAGDPRDHPVQVLAEPSPDVLLGWHLRDFRKLRWVLAVAPEAGVRGMSPMLITPAAAASRIPMSYSGSRYRIRRAGVDGETVILWIAVPGPS